MFSYYGSKAKIAHRYPAPQYPLVVEPFAGAARYSFRHVSPDIDVHLNDLNPTIYDLWSWLIHEAEPQDITSIPDLEPGDSLKDFDLTEDQRRLMGFAVGRGATGPRHVYTGRAARDGEVPRTKRRVLKHLPLVKHWRITNVDYRQLPDVEATWFVDPPYVVGGDRYPTNQVNYVELADWCRSRRGQVIVCENSAADWLPFRPLCELQGSRHTTTEVIWTN